MSGTEYIIVGNYALSDGHIHECLVTLCGKSIDEANAILHRMLTNPTENDIRLIKDGKNLRIKEVDSKTAWWNDPVMVR